MTLSSRAFVVVLFGFLALAVPAANAEDEVWSEVVPGVLRSRGYPCAYALVEGRAALLIGAPRGARLPALKQRGVETCELVLLTHHHRDSSEQAAALVAEHIPVRAPKRSEPLLSPEGVRDFWTASMPVETPNRFPPLFERSWNKWSYLVHPVGIRGIRCDLEDGQKLVWRGWKIDVIATPGHSPDHLAFVASRAASEKGPLIAFCGDALSQSGKIWAPYTTDWHHVNDDGLRNAAESLKTLAAVKPTILCPEHGPPITTNALAALAATAEALSRAARLKSYQRYSDDWDGQPLKYAFVAEDQVGSANPQGNQKPWTKLTPHLFLSGNTYALVSKDGPVLLVDPYSQNVVQRVRELKQDHGFGPVEVVMISHAHNDHYTGVFALPGRESFQVWTLDQVADVIGNPGKRRAPYVDARVVKTDRRLKHEQTVEWREYRLKISHLPGQTVFTMGIEVKVDDKTCFFTGDNFYHVTQYSGSGGWSGLNRGLPDGYVRSIQRVLEARPDWVLAEHGGAFEFNADDFRRRLRWAQASAAAASTLSPSGDHAQDWDPHRINLEPFLVAGIPSRSVRVEVVVKNPLNDERKLTITFNRPDLVVAKELKVTVPPHAEKKQEVDLFIKSDLKKGRHVVPLVIMDGDAQDGSDTFFILEVE
jgi:glyoxylase-like metal-dependent hydrolase (beta-lactamase superfamily II)